MSDVDKSDMRRRAEDKVCDAVAELLEASGATTFKVRVRKTSTSELPLEWRYEFGYGKPKKASIG